jgi:hypothetical protein
MMRKVLISGFAITILDSCFGWYQGKEMKVLQTTALKLTEEVPLSHVRGIDIHQTVVQQLQELQMRLHGTNPFDIPRRTGIWAYDTWWNLRQKRSVPLKLDTRTVEDMLALARYHLGVSYLKDGELEKARGSLYESEKHFDGYVRDRAWKAGLYPFEDVMYLKACAENAEGVLWLSRGKYEKA